MVQNEYEVIGTKFDPKFQLGEGAGDMDLRDSVIRPMCVT